MIKEPDGLGVGLLQGPLICWCYAYWYRVRSMDTRSAGASLNSRRIGFQLTRGHYIRVSTGWRRRVLTSQSPVTRWHEQIGDPTVADGILDRLVHNAHRIEMRGDSMRKNRGKTNT